MALPLKKRNLNYIIEIVQDYQRNGSSLNAFLTDYFISNKEWKKFVKKNKVLRNAIEDGQVYYKAFWEREMARAMNSKNGNSTLQKLALENALGWTALSKEENAGDNNPKMYKVILDLGPEDGMEDKTIPEKEETPNVEEKSTKAI